MSRFILRAFITLEERSMNGYRVEKMPASLVSADAGAAPVANTARRDCCCG